VRQYRGADAAGLVIKSACLVASFYNQQLRELVMTPSLFLGLTFLAGFAGGYLLRAQISFRRRRRRYSRA
jgi:hypothetical protein